MLAFSLYFALQHKYSAQLQHLIFLFRACLRVMFDEECVHHRHVTGGGLVD